MRKEKSCGAVVYRWKDGSLLFLVERMVMGHVSIPKGHVEDGETEEETARREIREETGLEVRLFTDFRHVVTYSPSKGTVKDVVFFLAEALPGEMKPQECEVASLEWLPFDEACRVMSYPSDAETIRLAREVLLRPDRA